MGKVDDMRAMREARYERLSKVLNKPGLREKVEEVRAKMNEPEAAAEPEELCGHQSISKARCTRPKDHPEKNHRYK